MHKISTLFHYHFILLLIISSCVHCCSGLFPYDFVLAAAMLRIFGSNDEHSGLAGVYTFNSSDRYFGYAVVNAVCRESQSCKQFYWVLVANVTFSEEA